MSNQGQIPVNFILKSARISQATVSGISTVLLQIPGTPGTEGGRWMEYGEVWFENRVPGDFLKVYLTDEDNITGAGVGAVLDVFHDSDVPNANSGLYFPPGKCLEISNLGKQVGTLMSGLYFKVVATKGDLSSDTLRGNMYWGVGA